MGTRGVWGFHKNGKDKLTYNHFDSYPEGLGEVMVNFIDNVPALGLSRFCDDIILVDEESTPSKKSQEFYKKHGVANLNVGNRSTEDWYCLLRELQGEPEKLYSLWDETKHKVHIVDNNSFIRDSLFCEYGYIVNLDNNTLEFYVGFQKKPQEGNRYQAITDGKEEEDFYYPCKLAKSFPLDEIRKSDVAKVVEEMQEIAAKEEA